MACVRGVAAGRDQHIDHLAVLVDRSVEVAPAARNFDISLVHEPPVTGCASGWSGGVDELRSEGLHPSVHRDVVDGDAALGQLLFDIAVGQAVAQVQSHPDRDHLPREAVPSRSRRPRSQPHHRASLPGAAWAQPTQQRAIKYPWRLYIDPTEKTKLASIPFGTCGARRPSPSRPRPLRHQQTR
jgi:hypothetical protein